MAYSNGTANGMFGLLDKIKETAVSAGWQVVKESVIPYTNIKRGGAHFTVEKGEGAISENQSDSTTQNVIVIFPRPISLNSLTFKSANSITLNGVLFDLTREKIGDGFTDGAVFSDEVKAKRYIQVEAVTNGATSNYDLNFTCDTNAILQRDLVITNGDDVNQVILNFSAFIDTNGRTNIAAASCTGYSENLPIEKQLNAKLCYILGDDGEIKYNLSFNNNRMLLSVAIFRPDDATQKNEVRQIVYLGRIRIYGGEWALPDCNIILGSKENLKWNEYKGCGITKTFIYYANDWREADTCAFNSAVTSVANCDIVSPPNGEMFSAPIVLYDNYNVFGEIDGLYNLIMADNINYGDTITIENNPYIVVADNIGFNKFDTYAFKKD